MDITTIIGLLLGAGMILWSIMTSGDLRAFADFPSVLVVCGGGMAAALISFPLKNLLSIFKVVKNAFFTKAGDPNLLITDLVNFAEIARRDGILSLENALQNVKDPFIITGIQMAVDGTDPELIEQIMQAELEAVEDRHSDGKALFDNMAKYGPAFGMIGTLIGLVIMLQNMQDPSKIGPAMAVALLTTFYGSIIANLIALPIGDKLALRSKHELMLKSIVIRGVMAIQSGDNPRIVEQKLKTFLPHRLRHAQKEAA